MQSMIEILSQPVVSAAAPSATHTVKVTVAVSQVTGYNRHAALHGQGWGYTHAGILVSINLSIAPTFTKTTHKEKTEIISQIIASPASVGVFPPWWIS